MGDTTGIAWTDATWNPVTGCTKVSPGCLNCYIDRSPPFRIEGRGFHCPRCGGTGYVEDADGNRFAPTKDKRLIPGARCTLCDGKGQRGIGDTTGVRLHHDRLDWPLRKRSWRGKRVFVCSLADLFHKSVPDDFIACVWAVMALTPEVTYQVLTKRPARMRALLRDFRFWEDVRSHITETFDRTWEARGLVCNPLPNVHIGVTVEDQDHAAQRIPILLDTPAALRWLSVEPLLGPVDLGPWLSVEGDCGSSDDACPRPAISWVVVGGESGPGARAMRDEWARDVVRQCLSAGVPVFVKQMGTVWAREHGLRGKADELDDLPEDLRVREFPGGASW